MNLLIDTNYILRKHAWLRSSGAEYLSTQSDRKDLIESMLYNVNTIIKRYNYINRIIFCFDSLVKSWRFILPYHDIYKSGRKPSNRYDNQGFKKAVLECQEFLEKNGYCSMIYPQAEGDDLLYIASNILFNADESSVIVTADADMKQLVKSNGKNFIFVFNNDSQKNQTHYVDEINATSDTEVMSMESFFDQDVERFNKSIIYGRCEQIIPEESLFSKILSGDKSDTIPSAFFYQKGTMQYGFTEKRAKSVFEKYYREDFMKKAETIDSLFSDDEKLTSLATRIIQEVGKVPDSLNITDVKSRLKTNKRYIHLSVSSFDQNIYDDIENYVIECLGKTTKAGNFDYLFEEKE